MRRRLLLSALGTGWVLAFFGPLLSPALSLANRDVPLFHLPLRSALARLAEMGTIGWNPWLHGGQPLLSNPNYAAFYPPTWLALAVGPAYGLGLLVVFHAAVAFAGAWLLARRLGCEAAPAALAALAFSGGGTFLSLTASFNYLCALAWFPWVLAAAEEILGSAENDGAETWLPPAAWGGGALALQLLAGEPAAVLVTALAVVCLALTGLRRPRVTGRLGALFAIALALGAVQLLPTWQHLETSPRSEVLPLEVAGRWSSPPVRTAELALPRLWGDPARVAEGRYYGWNLHDADYPYIPSIYPGLLVTLLALAALLRWPLRRRAGWIAAIAVGLLLAWGRYDPLFPWLHQHLPILGRMRFPEKLLPLATAVLPFVAAAGWQHLLEERRRGRAERADLPLVLAALLFLAVLGLTAWVHLVPAAPDPLLRAGTPLEVTASYLEQGRSHLRHEARSAAMIGGLAVLVLALHRWRRVSRRAVVLGVLALLATDLWLYGHGLLETVPAELYRHPPPLVERITQESRSGPGSASAESRRPGAGGSPRIFRRTERSLSPRMVLDREQPELRQVEQALARIDPLSGLLWPLGHAFPPDYDLMLTAQARANRLLLEASLEGDDGDPVSELRGLRDETLRILGAWSVGHVVLEQGREPLLQAAVEGRRVPAAYALHNPYVLDRYRFVPAVVIHRSLADARRAARSEDWNVIRREHWIDPLAEPGPRPAAAAAELLEIRDRGGRIEIRYRAARPAWLVAAVTFDPGWSAQVEGAGVPLHATALGQMGMLVPAGEHLLELRYRNPWVLVGGVVTGLSATGLLALLLALRWRRQDREPQPEEAEERG